MRLKTDDDDWYVTFFVRPPRGTTTSKLAFLVSTVTYMAYSNYHWLFHERFCEVTEALWTTLDKGDVFLQEHNEIGLSTYDTHSDGSSVRYASRLRPVLNMAAKTPLCTAATTCFLSRSSQRRASSAIADFPASAARRSSSS